MRNIFLILFLTSFSYIHSQSEVRAFPMSENSLFWEISGNGLKSPSVIYGTMHLMTKDNFILPRKIIKTLKKSEVLLMELDATTPPPSILDLLTLKDGSFFDFFTSKEIDSIYAWGAVNLHLDSSTFKLVFDKMKPFVLLQQAIANAYLQEAESYEVHFEKVARNNTIKILGLETMAEQIALFDELEDSILTELVMEAIRSIEKSKAELIELEELYLKGNIDGLYTFGIETQSTISAETKLFIIDRNIKWIPLIMEQIEASKTFIAIGAGHLGGQSGVIRLLEAEGYTLTPIKL